MSKLNNCAVIEHCGICHRQFQVPGCPQRFDTADLTIPKDCPLPDVEVITPRQSEYGNKVYITLGVMNEMCNYEGQNYYNVEAVYIVKRKKA